MADAVERYEKLGAFYLGKRFDLRANRVADELVLYDAKDLVTHAVIVGMTGSGKTGLGVGLLEEAAIDSIPALVIDPKGDLGNLLLGFPQLQPSDFEPWINRDDARRTGKDPHSFAAEQSENWRKGLASWDQDGGRIARMQAAAEFTIYTPGSDAGIPLSILSSFAAPPPVVVEDSDLFRDRIGTTATSLLALLEIDADPIRSREHILLTNILEQNWRAGRDLDLGQLIEQIQNPPVTKIGVMDLESFFPAKDRFTLAMMVNNLLAAPGFAAWLQGEPLDVDRLLYAPDGRPRIAILSIAHLSDAERMFFVSLLLNQLLGWMRSRSGTTSLRALLYIDELFGYMPPIAEPPSKKPLLTLLKQARAYGVGLVLATQNPVDLDYKGLANAGTWFLGRLQTERDKMRVLEGLKGASDAGGAAFDSQEFSEILSNLGKRVFLLHNVHEDAPIVFQTRWTLSYLAGPMTREQIKQCMETKKVSSSSTYPRRLGGTSAGSPRAAEPSRSGRADLAASPISSRPMLPPQISQVFLPVAGSRNASAPVYEPRLLGIVNVHYVDSRRGLSADEQLQLLADCAEGPLGINWDDAESITLSNEELQTEPIPGAQYAELPAELAQEKTLKRCQKELADYLYRTRRYELYKSESLGIHSEPGESERDFRIRLTENARQERDALVDQLRKKYAPRLRTLEDRVRRAEGAVEREKNQASSARWQSVVSVGATVLGALLGRKRLSSTTVGRASTAARGMGRAAEQASDVRRAEENLANIEQEMIDLQAEFDAEVAKLERRLDPLAEELVTYSLKPRKTDIDVRMFAIAWDPGAGSGRS